MLRGHARRALMLSCAVGAGLAACPALALAAATTTQSARSGIVSATFSFQGSFPTISNEMLTIDRSGQAFYSAAVTSKLCPASRFPCAPGSNRSVHVVNLEGNGEPDVVLDLFSGGADCCTVEQVFSYDPGTMTYVKTERNFSMAEAKLEDLSHHGRYDFVTSDASFECTFTDCADSGAPIEILAFGNRRFTPITTKYPKLIAKDAARWLKLYRHHLSNGDGLIAAWAGDEDLLGHRTQVKSYLAEELAAKHLANGSVFPSGQKFISALNKFLRRHGYVR